MLAMAQQHYIKYLRDVKDQSISQIADQLGVNWRTARKYADCSDWNKEARPLRGKFPIMEAYREQVDTWLLEDQLVPENNAIHQNVYMIALFLNLALRDQIVPYGTMWPKGNPSYKLNKPSPISV